MSSATGIKAGKAYVELFTKDSRLRKGLARASKRLKAFGTGVKTIGLRIAKLGAIAVVPIALATKTFADFSDQMALVRAVTGASAKQFKALTDQAKLLGRTTAYTASQVAAGMVVLGRQGFKPDEIAAALPHMMALARSTGSELADAAGYAAAAMRGFNLAASDSQRITDIMTATANNSAQDLETLGDALKYVAPFASAAGESFTNTAAALGVLANQGIKGTMAGTALRRAYMNLSKTATQTKLKGLTGTDVVDAAGNLRPVAEILTDIGNRVRNMPSGKKLGIFSEIFGRGASAAIKLSESKAAFADLQKVIGNSSGVAMRTMRTMEDTLGGGFRRLRSAIEGIAIAIGEALEGDLREFGEWITGVARKAAKWISENKQVVVTILKVTAAVIAGGIALMILGGILGGLGTILGVVAGALGVAGSILGFLLSPVGLVTAAFVGLGIYLAKVTGAGGKALDWFAKKWESLKNFAGKSIQGIQDALAAGDIGLAARILWLSLKYVWEKGVGWLSGIWLDWKYGFIETMTTAWNGIRASIQIVWNWLQKGWQSVCRGMTRGWETFIGWVKNAWHSCGAWLSKAWTWLRGRFDSKFDEQAAYEATDKWLHENKEQVDKGHAESDQWWDKEGRKLDAAAEQSLADIGREHQAAMQGLRESKREELKASADAVNAARKEWRAALDEARRKRKAKEAAEKNDDVPKGPPAPPEMPKAPAIPRMPDLAHIIDMSKASVRGTFNATALGGLGAGSATDRIAKATEETAKNTKKLAKRPPAEVAFI